jgi:hypothetical protein
MTWCIVYLASPRSFMTGANRTGHLRYDVLRASLLITRRVFPNTDIIVFHEDYTDEDIRKLPAGIVFEKIDFSGFESIYNRTLPSSRGYLMMCRFFSGVMQSHPRLQRYTHYIRLDDDSYFLEPYITGDLVESLCSHDYVFRALFHEAKSQQSLYEFTMNFLRPKLSFLQLSRLKKTLVSRKFLTDSGMYTGLAPYNNFHISSLRLWKHPLVRGYINAIEASGGIFRNGWLDANIHAMIVYIFPYVIPDLSVMPCSTFGYRHNCHVCPVGSLGAKCDDTIPFYPPADQT